MAARLVFSLSNNYTQDNGTSQGICTAASLAWAKACLKKGAAVNSYSELGVNQLALEAQMQVIRKLDSSPLEQTSNAGLGLIAELSVNSIDEVIRKAKQYPPHVAIFWNSFHTMGYRYSHNQKEFFDMNEGLFRAKTSDDIKAKMTEIFRSKGYGSVLGMRIVSLS
jgi:hypothetical protein